MKKLLPILTILLISLLLVCPAQAASLQTDFSPEPQRPITIYYAGPEGGVSQAVDLANFQRVEDPSQAQVLVLNGVIPQPDLLRQQLESGAGLVLILGPDLSSAQVQDLLGIPLELTPRQEAASLVETRGASHILLEEVIWNSAPQVRSRAEVITPLSSVIPLVSTFEEGGWVLWSALGGRAYIFNVYLDGDNPQIQEWAYFNYLVYSLVCQAGGEETLSFADYPGSPVPHSQERTILLVLLAGILALVFLVFILVRRYSQAHPEALDTLVVNRQEFEQRQANTEWDTVGFHRPLGGFMLALMLGLVLFIPLIIYQNLVLPTYILPSAQALGIWGRVTQFFNFLWLLFDMGTSAAFIKFFAEMRVHDPRKAIQYGQIFVWWQALSGAFQVALIATLASTMLPKTAYALYAWSVILHTFIQIPGFFQVMRHALMGWQRFDYAQVLDLGLALVFPILTQPVLVTLMVLWGRNHPAFGPSMGGLLGLGLAAYAAEALTFVLGFWLYRRLGYNARLLFLAHFDWQTIKSAFRFGLFEMLGSLAWAVGQAVEILITQTRLVNYTEVWGNWGLAQNFIFAYQVLQTLYSNIMPSISEAISAARVKLSQYYSAMAYKYGGMMSAYVGAVLLAVADRFILGASGPEFTRAAAYAIPLILWGAVQYPSWVGDSVQLASNRPYLKSMLVGGEQLVRIILAYWLLERFQINALILAYFVGLLSKGILAYLINHRVCFPQRLYFWQSLAAPLLAGASHYLLLRWITGLIWQGDQVTSILIFLIGILLSYPVFAFFYGLFGGWDNDTLAELGQAAELSGFMRPLARVFWRASALGARISPLHNRYPIDIRQAAIDEAAALTAERVNI